MAQLNTTTAKELRPLRRAGMLDSKPISHAQALRIGKSEMPADLKRAGFIASVFVSDEVIHGDRYFRISYSK